MVDTVVRPAETHDVCAVRELAEEWVARKETIGLAAPSEAVLAAVVGQCFFVAEKGAVVVGFVWGQVKTDASHAAVVPASQPYLEIEDLYVTPESRSSGIGRDLVETAAAWAWRAGVRFVVAYSSTRAVDRVLHFYRTCGFESWSVQVFRDLDGGDGARSVASESNRSRA
jgi:GNAT superfamily N-acetyltransferase